MPKAVCSRAERACGGGARKCFLGCFRQGTRVTADGVGRPPAPQAAKERTVGSLGGSGEGMLL
jgi:hypothetical protein